MMVKQHALRFECKSCWLLGILSLPAQALRRGILIFAGGPQYRVGSHRQFTLLAAHLAALGIPVMRFDYRGMGDSEGEARTFEDIDDDLQAAVLQFFDAVPNLKEIVIWGLCDAATAAASYAHKDSRICGLILLNPWVRTEASIARTTLRHYYLGRLLEGDFWRKLASGRFKLGQAAHSLRQLSGAARLREDKDSSAPSQRLFDGLSRFQGRLLIVLSENDLTAREFSDLKNSSSDWRRLVSAASVRQVNLAQANHTFSRRVWRDEVAQLCGHWIASWYSVS